jgi:hypothetical protein
MRVYYEPGGFSRGIAWDEKSLWGDQQLFGNPGHS